MEATASLTPDSLALFDRLCRDAGNWNGMPMLDVTAATRGNLTQLKKAGLLHTEQDEDNARVFWVVFHDSGYVLAERRGNTVRPPL